MSGRLGRLRESFSRRFGATAPRLAVRTHIPWPLRVLVLTFVIFCAAALGWWIYDAGRRDSGFEEAAAALELERLSETSERLQKENEELRAASVSAERQLQIERASHDDLARQVKQLGEDNARLKEDLAFFQNLIPAAGKASGVQIYRFKVERDKLPGEYRYGLLLAQSGQRVKEFQGSLQLVINLQHNGMEQVLTLPEDAEKFPRGQSISFRYYQRVEGRFRVDPDAVVESLQVRVYSGTSSEATVTQTAKVS